MTTLTESPKAQAAIKEFNRNIRYYWKQNIKKYFTKRENQYGLDPKVNHRFMISPYTDSREPRLRNAIIINWTPATNHVTVKVAPIMVKGRPGKPGTRTKSRIRTRTRIRTMTGEVAQKAYDLIEILRKGTRSSRKKYIVSLDARINRGTRGPQKNDQWKRWFDGALMVKIDRELNILTDKLEDVVVEELE